MANEAKQLLPAYLITGKDELKRRTTVEHLRKRIGLTSDLTMNSSEFDGQSADIEEVISACNTLPFGGDTRLIVVTSVDRFKAKAMAALVDYLEQPCPTTVLCMVTVGVMRNTRLYKATAALGEDAIIDCASKTRRELPNLVRSMATTHGVVFTPSAANVLIDLVGTDTVALDASVAQLALAHIGGDPVTDNEVTTLIGRTAEVKPWTFVDAFAARDAKKCLMLRPRLASEDPLRLLGLCTTRIRELMIARALIDRGQIAQLAARLGVPDWQAKNLPMWAKRFTDRELHSALVGSRDVEWAIKSGGDAESLFDDWYLGVIIAHDASLR